MNCRTFRKNMGDLFDPGTDPADLFALRQHLADCPECSRIVEPMRQAADALQPSHEVKASPQFKERVMNKINQIEAAGSAPQSRFAPRSWTRRLAWSGAAVAVMLMLTMGYNFFAGRNGREPITAFGVLAHAAEVMSKVRSLHMKVNMRGLPGDNFEFSKPDLDFIPIDIWKKFGDPSRWRVEKSGRVVVMDGESSTLWIKPNNIAAKGGRNTGFIEWLKPLLDPTDLLDYELDLAKRQGSDLELAHEKLPDGTDATFLTIRASAQGDFSQSDHAKNRSITESDNTRTYAFDEQGRLVDLQVFMHTEEGDVLVFEIDEIEYDIPIDPALFTLDLPEDVNWWSTNPPEKLPDNAHTVNMKPDEAARAFFQACANEDWDEVLKFWPMAGIPEKFKLYLGGLEIVSIGKPFQSGQYPGWFVPYEIKLKVGETKKHNLAIRNDNPAKRWQFDGGL